jgi:hypothetical protein
MNHRPTLPSPWLRLTLIVSLLAITGTAATVDASPLGAIVVGRAVTAGAVLAAPRAAIAARTVAVAGLGLRVAVTAGAMRAAVAAPAVTAIAARPALLAAAPVAMRGALLARGASARTMLVDGVLTPATVAGSTLPK